MGNWIDITEQYVKTKTPQECEEHYFTFYYKSKTDCFPNEDDTLIIGQRTKMNCNPDAQFMSPSKDKGFVGTRRKQEEIKNKEDDQKYKTQF